MVAHSSPQVKSNSRPATFQIGDPEDKLSIAHAMAEGYKLTLDGDGCAEVLKDDGTAYHVADWQCNCPDAISRNGCSYEANGRRFCKHVLWLTQVYPCHYCGSTMPLTEHTTTFGETFRTFDCPTCKASVDFGLVRGQRRMKRIQARQQAEAAGREVSSVSA